MRLTQFSIFLSVPATQSSKLLNINGQHGCSNTESTYVHRISTAQSVISSVLRQGGKFSLWKTQVLCVFSTEKCSSCSANLSIHISLSILHKHMHNKCADSSHSVVASSEIRVNFCMFLVGQDVCLTHSNFFLTHFKYKQRDIVWRTAHTLMN